MSKQDFVYDVQGMCKSFYPSTQIVMTDWDEKKECGDLDFLLKVRLEDDLVEMWYFRKDFQEHFREAAPADNRRGYKNVLKKMLYGLCSKETGQELPWGTLTGVRPTKLVMERLEAGDTKEEMTTYMKEHYFCSDDKIALGYEISKVELDILHAIDYSNGYSLYVGIPFCPTRCSYCSFAAYPVEQFGGLMDEYLKALYKEIEYTASRPWNKRLSTIYIGGGTPTTLDASQLRGLIRKIKECFDMEHVVEFTVEAGRPDSITKEKLKVLLDEGITRISINPQTMNQSTLERIGRKHTVEDVEEIFKMARNMGMDNINMDLIIGLPGETTEDVRRTMERIEKLSPDNLTVHSLVLKRAARLNTDRLEEESKRRETVSLVGETETMGDVTQKYAKSHGYIPYYMYRQKNATGTDSDSRENIGYAKPGKECVYNVLIMEEKQTILALGAGASSKFLLSHGKKKIERVENVKSVTDYIERIDEMIDRKEEMWKTKIEPYMD